MKTQNLVYLILSAFFIIGSVVLIFLLTANNEGSSEIITEEIENNTETMSEELEKNSQNNSTMANNNVTIVEFTTNYGNFKAEVYTSKSPITAGNFISLVEDGFYDGTRFHRVIEDFMIQGGDPQSKNISLASRWGTGGPGYAIEDEFIQGLSNTIGTLSMANSGPQSGGSQFFINVADNTFLDFNQQPLSSKHPVFGKIIEGMDIVNEISTVQTAGANRPVEDIVIESIKVVK